MILLDTSGVLAALNDREPRHRQAAAVLGDDDGPLVLSPFVLAEIDYLLARGVGEHAEVAFLAEVGAGAYDLASFTPADVLAARRVIERYQDQGIGLADASLVVLADRYGTGRILTLDVRHFRVLRRSRGDPFEILPAPA